MESIANVGNKTSDSGKSLYQIPHAYNINRIRTETCTLRPTCGSC